MVTKRIRSEYTKKFKDPKWDTYAQCYEDLVKYRLSRRLLEQAHNPWFWGECGSDTESSGKSTPRGEIEAEALQKVSAPHPAEPAQETTAPGLEEDVTAEVKEPDTSQIQEELKEDIKPQENEKDKSREASPVANVVQPKTHPSVRSKSKSKLRHLQKPARIKAKHHTTKDTEIESRHPFALYGSGERQADMASKRTHNVGPAASTKEIHESALRAKTRREVEKKMRRVDKRRAKSADLEKRNKTEIITDYNPWMTEYMRCFSARSQ